MRAILLVIFYIVSLKLIRSGSAKVLLPLHDAILLPTGDRMRFQSVSRAVFLAWRTYLTRQAKCDDSLLAYFARTSVLSCSHCAFPSGSARIFFRVSAINAQATAAINASMVETKINTERFGLNLRSGSIAGSSTWIRAESFASSRRAASYCFANSSYNI